MIKCVFVPAFAGVLAAAVPAFAQDVSLEPNFATVDLEIGFTPDPYSIDVVAGGPIDASRLRGGCVGRISDAPDVRVNYRAGALPLAFRTRAEGDTTLIVNAPDGSWHCDDDSWADGDAEVAFFEPASGVYDVWIGTYGEVPVTGELILTETP